MGSIPLLRCRVRMLRNTLFRRSTGSAWTVVGIGILWLVYVREMTSGLVVLYEQTTLPAALAVRHFSLVFGVGMVYALSHAFQRLTRPDETLLIEPLPLSRSAKWVAVLWDVSLDTVGVFALPLPFILAYGWIHPNLAEKVLYGLAWAGISGMIAALGVVGAVLLTLVVTTRGVYRFCRTHVAGIFRLASASAALWLLVTLAENAQQTRQPAPLDTMEIPPVFRALPTTWTADLLRMDRAGIGWTLCVLALFVVGAFALSFAAYTILFSPEMVLESGSPAVRRRMKPPRPMSPFVAHLTKEWLLTRRDSRLLLGWAAPAAWVMIVGYLTTRDEFSLQIALPAMAGTGFLGATLAGLSSVGREGAAFRFVRTLLPEVRSYLLAKGVMVGILTLPLILFWVVDWTAGTLRWDLAATAAVLTVAWSVFSVGISARFPRFDAPSPVHAVRLAGVLLAYVYLILVMGCVLVALVLDWEMMALPGLLGVPMLGAVGVFVWGIRSLDGPEG